MAREFDGSQHLTHSGAPVTGEPFTLACWYLTTDAAADQVLISLAPNSGNYHALALGGTTGGDPVSAVSFDGSAGVADSTAGFSTSTWQHACAVFAAADDRRVYLNGTNKGTNTDSITPGTLAATALAYSADTTPGYHLAGNIAEAAVWDVALTDAEVAMLAQGVSPLLVRPAHLVAYWPLIRDEDQDRVGGYHLTPVNSPTVANHPTTVLSWWHRYARAVAYGAASPPPTPAPAHTIRYGDLWSGPGLSGGVSNPLHSYAGRILAVTVSHAETTAQTVTFYDATPTVPSPAADEILVLHVAPTKKPFTVRFPRDAAIPFTTGLCVTGTNCNVQVWSIDHG